MSSLPPDVDPAEKNNEEELIITRGEWALSQVDDHLTFGYILMQGDDEVGFMPIDGDDLKKMHADFLESHHKAAPMQDSAFDIAAISEKIKELAEMLP